MIDTLIVQRGITTYITADDVERAYEDMVIAADLVEIAVFEQMPRRVIEYRRDALHRATDRYDAYCAQRLEQCELEVA